MASGVFDLESQANIRKKRPWVTLLILAVADIVYLYTPEKVDWIIPYAVICIFAYMKWKQGEKYGYKGFTKQSWIFLGAAVVTLFVLVVVFLRPMFAGKNVKMIESSVTALASKDWEAWNAMLHPNCDPELRDPEAIVAALQASGNFPSGEVENITMTGYHNQMHSKYDTILESTARVVIGGKTYRVTVEYAKNTNGSGIVSLF